MKRQYHNPQPSCYAKDNRGFVAISVVITITALLSVLLVNLTLIGITAVQTSGTRLAGIQVKTYAEGCVDEALLQLKRDPEYNGDTIEQGRFSCTITVIGSENTRTIAVVGTGDTTYHNLEISVQLSPFMITQWDI